jgi:alpha-pyrone synthase
MQKSSCVACVIESLDVPVIPYINHIATVVPPYDVHQKFIDYAPSMLSDNRQKALFQRAAERSGIAHRYSFLEPDPELPYLDTGKIFLTDLFPGTSKRMQLYKQFAFPLAQRAIDALGNLEAVSHIIITSCTGFYAPGLDWQIIEHYGLNRSIERTVIGFMGCYAAINGLKAASHIVRSQPDAVVLVVNIELCTLHLQQLQNLEQLLSFLIFADGCAASLVSAESRGMEIQGFHSTIIPDTEPLIIWDIGDAGFDMNLSGKVPSFIAQHLPALSLSMLNQTSPETITHWAVHPGGKSILDAVQKALNLDDDQLHASRTILRDYGNMSSPTIMFVLKAMLDKNRPGDGCALAFGPGLSVETMRFAL